MIWKYCLLCRWRKYRAFTPSDLMVSTATNLDWACTSVFITWQSSCLKTVNSKEIKWNTAHKHDIFKLILKYHKFPSQADRMKSSFFLDSKTIFNVWCKVSNRILIISLFFLCLILHLILILGNNYYLHKYMRQHLYIKIRILVRVLIREGSER